MTSEAIYQQAMQLEKTGDHLGSARCYRELSLYYYYQALEADEPNRAALIEAGKGAASLAIALSHRKNETLHIEREAPCFNEIMGLQAEKNYLREQLILPYTYPDVFRQFGIQPSRGYLLYGPPGTGKSSLIQAAAREIEAECINVDSATLLDKYVGESEGNLIKLFKQAREKGRTIICFDEAHALCNTNREDSDVIDRVVSVLAVQMEAKENNQLIFFAATNWPDRMDRRLLRPGRFGEWLYIGLPEEEAREQIARFHLGTVPVEEIGLATLIAQHTEGCNGADVVRLTHQIKLKAALRQIRNNESGLYEPVTVSKADLGKALECIRSSVFQEDVQRCLDFRNNQR